MNHVLPLLGCDLLKWSKLLFFGVCCELENFPFLSYFFTSEANLALIISADSDVVFNVLVTILPEPWSLYKYTQLSRL